MKTTKIQTGEIESAIALEGVTREMYCEKMIDSATELVDYDMFLENIAESVNYNNGNIDDAVEIAIHSFRSL